MHYVEVEIKIIPYSGEISEILIAELSQKEFDSFVDTPDGFFAYIPQKAFETKTIGNIISSEKYTGYSIGYNYKLIPEQNWNTLWESNFEPIKMGTKCLVCAPFHNVPEKFDYTIVIEPKMSFGTGHHETTYLMLQELLELDLDRKEVLDMGCGTGILAILASMRGAKNILAIDVDEWAYINTVENVKRNKCRNVEVIRGDIQSISDKKFDVIIANINRNVLLEDIKSYTKSLKQSGVLLMSGFYTDDLPSILSEAEKNGLSFVKSEERNKWCMAKIQGL